MGAASVKIVSLERLRWLLDYDRATGLFTWKNPRVGGPIKPGTPAGSAQDRRGYRQIMIDGQKYHAQVLAWFYVHGEWPKRHIWFDDNNPQNLKFDNLRYGEFHYSTKEGRNAYDRSLRKKHPDRFRAADLKKFFGLTVEDYMKMWEAQKGLCAICERPETLVRFGRVARLAVDHNHTTGAIRDLLCARCNSMVGYSGESIERLQAGIEYLKRHAATPDNVVPLRHKEPA